MINASSIHISKSSLWFEERIGVSDGKTTVLIKLEGHPLEKL